MTIHSTNLRSFVVALKRRLGTRFGWLALTILCGYASTACAASWDFLSVSGNNIPGNAASTTFTSNNGNGVVTVSHQFSSPSAVGFGDNINSLINPSQFSTVFPGTGPVQGHLAMTVYGDANNPGGSVNTSQVTFDLTGYTGNLPDLWFGLWNTTDEVTLPAYNIQLLDAGNNIVPPSMVGPILNGDNQLQVAGKHQMQLNTLTGDITAPLLINNSGTHTDALFFKGIPTGTQQIIVTANLPPLNNIGDGVGYYFVEPVPEPSTWALAIVAAATCGALMVRSKRRQRRLAA